MDGKPLLKSKTFWVNLLTLGAAHVGALPAKYVPLVSAVVNIALRFLTKEPITSVL